jgi:hypothetical protein
MMTDGNAEVPAVQIELPREQLRSVRLGMHFVPDGREFTLEEFEQRTPMAYATGFYYKLDGLMFLVTARHNLTGRNNETGEFLSEYSTGPTHLHIVLREEQPPGGWGVGRLAKSHHKLIPILDAEWKPAWLEHPMFGPWVDVGVVPLPTVDEGYMIDAYEPAESGRSTPISKLWVAQDVFVVGYPYGLESGWQLPLWVRGTIASEPSLPYPHQGDDLPLFLVDARTRRGQSGASVILFRLPPALVMTEGGTITFTRGPQSRLLGVYSGRTNPESDLGFVWHIEEVDKICRGGVRGRVFLP